MNEYLALPWSVRTIDGSIGGIDDANDQVVVQVQQRPGDFKTKNADRRLTTEFVKRACNSHGTFVEALLKIARTGDIHSQALANAALAAFDD